MTLPPGNVLAPERAARRRTCTARLAAGAATRRHRGRPGTLVRRVGRAVRTEGVSAAPDVICWRETGEPLVLTYVPQWGWLLACSLPLLLLGVFLFTLARRSYAGRPGAALWFWMIVVVLAPVPAALWVFRPTILFAIAYGCEPGAVVLLLALAFQWLLLERYRRQIVFLPSFRRVRTGSSLMRTNAPRRPAGEPSTVDCAEGVRQ